MKTSLFLQLGGAPTVRAVVDEFYRRVLADETLAGHFAGVDMAAQRAHLTAFVGVVLGGPDGYNGRSMRDAHVDLDIGHDEFGAVAGHLRRTLEAAGVGRDDLATILNAVESLRADIVTESSSRGRTGA